MNHALRRIPMWALAFAAAGSFVWACSSGRDQAPPRKKLPSGSGGEGGAGGAGGGPSVDEAFCGCVASLGDDPGEPDSCATCFNDATSKPDECLSEGNACKADPGCEIIFQCMSACKLEPECSKACYLPRDKTSGHVTFWNTVECICPKCADKCTHGPTECKVPEPDAGADADASDDASDAASEEDAAGAEEP